MQHDDKHRTNANFLNRSRWWKDDCSCLAVQEPASTQNTTDIVDTELPVYLGLWRPGDWRHVATGYNAVFS